MNTVLVNRIEHTATILLQIVRFSTTSALCYMGEELHTRTAILNVISLSVKPSGPDMNPGLLYVNGQKVKILRTNAYRTVL